MAEGKGWISLYRCIQEHWLWQEKPFDKARAWIDLLLLANHKSQKYPIGNELIMIEPGCHLTSEKKLMKRWGWGNTKVRNFLKLLKSEKMIEYWGKKYTMIKIINYEMYQNQSDTISVISTVTLDTESEGKVATKCEQSASKVQANTNNNDNNDNKYINNNKEPLQVYQNNIFPMPGTIEIEGIKTWSTTLGNELVIYAIEIAAKNNARNWKYIERILIDWDKNGVKTIEEAQAYSNNRKKKGGKSNRYTKDDKGNEKIKYDFSKFGG